MALFTVGAYSIEAGAAPAAPGVRRRGRRNVCGGRGAQPATATPTDYAKPERAAAYYHPPELALRLGHAGRRPAPSPPPGSSDGLQ